MKNSALRKKIKQYSALAAATIAGVGGTEAQIGYTDIADQHLQVPYPAGSIFYPVDLDNNGINDMRLEVYRTITSSTFVTTYITFSGYKYGYMNYWYNNFVVAKPLNNNYLQCTASTFWGYFYGAALNKPDHVSSDQSYTGNVALLASWYDYSSGAWQNFSDWNEHYIGIVFNKAANLHFGWVRIRVNFPATSVDIYDYAYEQTPYGAIHAGGFPTKYTGNGNWNNAANWDKGIPTLADDAIINSGSTVNVTAPATCFNFINNGTLSFGGNFLLNVGAHFYNYDTFNAGAGRVTLNSNFVWDATRDIGGNSTIVFNNLIVNNPFNADNIMQQDVTVNSVLTITTTWALTINDNTLTIFNPIAGVPTELYGGLTSSITINGTSAGVNIPSSITQLNNVTLNNPGGTTLQNNLTVYGSLDLTNGKYTLGNYNLTLNNESGLTGGSDTSYIITNSTGLFRRTVASPQTYNFPLGSATDYNPASFSWVASPGITQLDGAYIPTTATNSTGLSVPVGSVTITELLDNGYWTFAPTGALSNSYDITLTRNGHTNAGANLNDHGIVKRTLSGDPWAAAGTWTDPGAVPVNPANTGQVSITQTNIGSFSDYATGKAVCNPPLISSDPVNDTVCATGNATFDVVATGTGLVYQWQEDAGSGFADLSDGGVYSGVSTATLTLTNVPLSMNAYDYRCIVTGACIPSDTSLAANLVVKPAPAVFIVNGGGAYCSETTAPTVDLSGSQSGVNYQLYYTGSALLAPVAGTGSGLSFGNQSQAGNYTVTATDVSSGCQETMTGSADVSIYNCSASDKSVAINTSKAPADSSAILDISDTLTGVLFPRLSDTDRDNLISPDEGLIIYNITAGKLNFYNGSGWYEISSTSLGVGVGATAKSYGAAINATGAVSANSAMLDISSSTKGLLIPRTLPGAVYGAKEGSIIYNTETKKINYYDGSAWVELSAVFVSGTTGAGSQTANGVAINITNANPAPSAVLDVASQNKAMLIPRLTDAQRNVINPATGLIIYNTDSGELQYYSGAGWYRLL